MEWNEWGEDLLVGGVKEQELVAVTGWEDLEPSNHIDPNQGEQTPPNSPSSWICQQIKTQEIELFKWNCWSEVDLKKKKTQ